MLGWQLMRAVKMAYAGKEGLARLDQSHPRLRASLLHDAGNALAGALSVTLTLRMRHAGGGA